jgi:hypothetical protein
MFTRTRRFATHTALVFANRTARRFHGPSYWIVVALMYSLVARAAWPTVVEADPAQEVAIHAEGDCGRSRALEEPVLDHALLLEGRLRIPAAWYEASDHHVRGASRSAHGDYKPTYAQIQALSAARGMLRSETIPVTRAEPMPSIRTPRQQMESRARPFIVPPSTFLTPLSN